MGEEQHVAGPEEASWILSTLERDQLVKEKAAPVPRRQLGGGALFLLWALRVYVVLMMAVVFWQAWTATR
ncbi:MAG: hypothetical protein WBG54_18680 [Acidobacteriaceae bacterium]